MKREEDKQVTFCLAYLNKEDVESEIKSTSHRQLIITFNEALPFTAEFIAKIAAAFDPRISALVVGKDRRDGKFSIWGGMFFGPSMSFFNDMRSRPPGHIFFRPDVFMVTAKSVGFLVISRSSSRIGTISAGIFTKSIPTPFFRDELGGPIEKIIRELHGFKDFKIEFYRRYIDALKYLLLQSSERGHGSTIVVLPDEPTDISQLPLVPKYAFSDKLGIENLIYETINYSSSSDFSSFASYRQKLGERLDFLAQLSAVDGALVLSPNLEVVTFGSTLNGISQWGGSILAGQDGFGGGGEPLDFSKYGTRHNAALGFVASCPGSIAFVISQDGPIRTFIMKDANTVICWLDTMTSMFI